MSLRTDICIRAAELYLLPVELRVPLKFGDQVLERVTCARVKVTVEGAVGVAEGWGETPLSAAWVWPSALPYGHREARLIDLCRRIAVELPSAGRSGHPLELGADFIAGPLGAVHAAADAETGGEPVPHLGALLAFSAFDLATYDAFGNLHGRPVFELLGGDFLSRDLGAFLPPDERFASRFPGDYLEPRRERLPVWHLVGGLDPIEEGGLTGAEPDDGYPVLLRDWIRRDGLRCLKVKLRGTDAEWDFARMVAIGQIAAEEGVDWLSADFNCTVTDPEYVNRILDRLRDEHPATYGRLLYVEQPFPYDLLTNRIDVHSVSARKPLFMDESAHDWTYVREGRALGWNGVALKTCKSLTGALLSLCWAKAHGMGLMVQDLTNPMLAQVPHALLAAHAGTIMGVESNGMQFYPEASRPEEAVHPGLYRRRGGKVDLSTLGASGFGYRIDEIVRELPEVQLGRAD